MLLIDSAWRDAIKQESLEPISKPDLSSGFDGLLESFNPGDELTFTLEADVAPTPKLKSTKGLKVEYEAVAYDPSRVDSMIDDSRKQLATVVPVEGRAAQKGDIAVLGFNGTYTDDGSEIEGGSADSMDVDLDNGRMIPGFIEGVIGMKVGENKSVDCQFPDDYPKEDARGRKAGFAIELKDLKTRELPELDDAFAKQASEQETMADLRKDLEQRLKDDAERRQTSNRHDGLVKALVEQLEVDLPEALIQQERRSFALTALAEAEDIKLDDSAIDTKLKEVKKDLSADAKVDPERLRQAVMDDLMQEQLMSWLETNSTLTEKAPEPESDTKS